MNERKFRMETSLEHPFSIGLHVVQPVWTNHLVQTADGTGPDVLTGAKSPRERL